MGWKGNTFVSVQLSHPRSRPGTNKNHLPCQLQTLRTPAWMRESPNPFQNGEEKGWRGRVEGFGKETPDPAPGEGLWVPLLGAKADISPQVQ